MLAKSLREVKLWRLGQNYVMRAEKKKEGLLVEGKMRKDKAQRPKITWRSMDLQFLPCG